MCVVCDEFGNSFQRAYVGSWRSRGKLGMTRVVSAGENRVSAAFISSGTMLTPHVRSATSIAPSREGHL